LCIPGEAFGLLYNFPKALNPFGGRPVLDPGHGMTGIALGGNPNPQFQPTLGSMVNCLCLASNQIRIAVDDVGYESPNTNGTCLSCQDCQKRLAIEPIVLDGMRINKVIGKPNIIIPKRFDMFPMLNSVDQSRP
jgi:hypothetical protein